MLLRTKALSSEIRIKILELLAKNQSLNLNDLANKLELSNGAITMHIKKLEESGLIEINTTVGKHGIQKICYLNKDKLMVDLRSKEVDNLYEIEIQIGHYSNYQALPTCGLATKNSIIGEFDDPRYFADRQRIDSEIIWLAEGFLEYRIPNYLKPNQRFKEIQFMMELGSEAPGYCENCPSDIYFYLNGIELGFWTSPDDFGDTRGTFNPEWWSPHLNQYGMLRLIRINHEGSFIDGCRISDRFHKAFRLVHQSGSRTCCHRQLRNLNGVTLLLRFFFTQSNPRQRRIHKDGIRNMHTIIYLSLMIPKPFILYNSVIIQ